MIKNLLNKVRVVKEEQLETVVEVEKLSHCDKIISWLKEYDKSWSVRKDNPNCFYSDSLEALYVYEDGVKYWEDIRCQSAVKIFPIPQTKLHLEKYMNTSIEELEKIKEH
jgi:hypothetical protein